MDITQQTIKFYEALLRVTGDGIVITGESQNIIVVNDAFCALLGRPRTDILETNLFDWLSQFDNTIIDRWARLETRLHVTGENQIDEFRITSNGMERYFSVTATLLRQAEPNVMAAIVSTWHDITKLKQLEQSLKEYSGNLEILVNERTSELKAAYEQNSAILYTSIEGFFKVDLDGRIIEANDSYCKMLGYSREEMLNMRVSDVEALEDSDEVKRHIEKIIGMGGDRFITKQITMQGRILDVEVSVNYIKDSNIMFAFIRDITDRVSLENALNELNANLQKRVEEEVEKNRQKDHMMFEQSRHTAMGELLMNISHHWRQPLGAIGVMIQDIKDAYKYKELDEKYLDTSVSTMLNELNGLSKTIDDFRCFYARDRQASQFSLSHAVNKAVSILEEYFRGRNISLERDMDDSITIHGYQNEFSQIILNLLTNIKDAFESRAVANGIIKVNSYRGQSGKAVLTILDNGGGVGEDIIGKLFDPYFTTRHKSRGTGLGLYIAKTVIEKNMNGTISARNIDGGCEFTIEV
ncbi:MAG: PAS domain S-box protein [Nitrospirae bacterium]|nr:PAS domain S-box protein [Nitrospirota bacterium]